MRNQDDVKISEFVQKLANAAPPAPPFPNPALQESPESSPPGQPLGWGPKLGFAAAAILFLVVPFFVFTGSTPPAPDATGTSPTTAIPIAQLKYPVSDYRVAEEGVVSASFVIPDPESPRHVAAVVARVDQRGFEDAVSVNVTEPDPGWAPLGDEVSIGNRTARVFKDSGSITVSWAEGGRFVWIQGSQTMDQDVLLAIAGSVTLTDGTFGPATLAIGTLPPEYSVFAAPGLRPVVAEPTLTLTGPPDPASFPRTPPDPVVVVEVSSDTPEHVAGRFPTGRKTVVRSVDGFLVSRQGSTAYVWGEHQGLTVTVTVSGSGSSDELLAVAESLRFVSEAEWRALYDIAESDPALPTTTIANGGFCRADQIEGVLGTGASDVQGPAQVIILTNVEATECLIEQPVSMSLVLDTGEFTMGSHGVPVSTSDPEDRVLSPGESLAVVYQIDEGCGSDEGLTSLRLEMSSFTIDVPLQGVAGCLRYGFLAPWSNGQLGFDDAQPAVTPEQQELADALAAFALDRTDANHSRLPLANQVIMTLGPDITKTVSSEELANPSVWSFESEEFRARTGSFSALDYLRDWPAGYEVSVGPHAHCAGPPQPTAEGLESLTQVSIQPVGTTSCIEWWVIDLHLNDAGEIAGITIDTWEP